VCWSALVGSGNPFARASPADGIDLAFMMEPGELDCQRSVSLRRNGEQRRPRAREMA